MTLVGCPSGKAYATTLEEVLALRSENATLLRRVATLEMVIAEEMHPCGECHLKPGERCDICGKQVVS